MRAMTGIRVRDNSSDRSRAKDKNGLLLQGRKVSFKPFSVNGRIRINDDNEYRRLNQVGYITWGNCTVIISRCGKSPSKPRYVRVRTQCFFDDHDGWSTSMPIAITSPPRLIRIDRHPIHFSYIRKVNIGPIR